MKTIVAHIKEGKFSPVYLLYGQEDYLRLLYRDKLREAILPPEDTMNYSYFEGKDIDLGEVESIADTVPFFSEQRLILIENSGLFKKQNDFADYLKTMPDTTKIIFVEAEVDKRNKLKELLNQVDKILDITDNELFKAVKKLGTVAELNGLPEKDLKVWAAAYLKKNGKNITEQNLLYFFQKVGVDMKSLENEMDKLIAYSMDETIITREMLDEVCVEQTEGTIFQMIDAIGMKDQDQALRLYYDLLEVREKPMSILFLIIRHFTILNQLKDLSRLGLAAGEVASKVGIPPFTVRKYQSQVKNFKGKEIIRNIERCAQVEQEIKTGLLLDQIGVELLIVEFSGTV